MRNKYRLASLFFIMLFSILLVSCNRTVPRKGIDTSNKFTSSDISKAMDIVEKDFKKNKIKGSKLESIVYDESKSNEILELYSETLKETYQPLNLDNFIVILINFKTGKDSGPLNPSTEYNDFQNIMVKQDKTWKIIDGGY